MSRKLVNLLTMAFLLCLVPSSIFAGWMRTYGGLGEQRGKCVLPLEDSTYLVLGSYEGIWLLKLDQSGDTIWTRNYWAYGASMDYTTDGGFVITGMRGDSLLLLKTDSLANLEWSRTYWPDEVISLGGIGHSVSATSDGGYIIAGKHEKAEMNEDLWLLKTDAYGEKVWETILYGDNDEGQVCDWGSSVVETSDGGYAVCGSRGGWWGYNDAELWYFKTNAYGDTVWNFSYREDSSDRGQCIRETPDGGYIITGSVDYFLSLIVMKLDASGEIQWKKIFDSFNSEGNWIEQTEDSNYIVVGYKTEYDSNADLWLLKFDKEGDTIWTRSYGSEDWDVGYCVKPDFDGGYIIAGTANSAEFDEEICLIKTNANGDTVVVAEEPVVNPGGNWGIVTSVGLQIVLRYENHPDGFQASIYDASGRKVDELHTGESSGIITWGEGYGSGVYFIRTVNGSTGQAISRVVIVK